MLTMTATPALALFHTHPLYELGSRTIPWNAWQLAASRPHHDKVKHWRHLVATMEAARQQQEETWHLTNDGEAVLDLRLPVELQDGSLSARLSEDGRSLKLAGQACKCQDTTFADIALPFGPSSADDLELVHGENDGLLTVRTRKPEKADLKIIKAPPAAEHGSDKPTQAAQKASSNAEEQEKELDRKFKVAIEDTVKKAAVVEALQSAAEERAPSETVEAGDSPEKSSNDGAEPEVPEGHTSELPSDEKDKEAVSP